MNFKIGTQELQDMVSKSIKCSSNNKLIPITSLMSIKVDEGYLTLATTDATNYFYVRSTNKVECEDFELCVIAELFTKLVQKITTKDIEIIVDGSIVTVKGNGTYTLELPLDENGSVIKFPKKYDDDFRPIIGDIKLSDVKNILNYNKSSLADNVELPVLTYYYCGDSVVTSDKFKICDNSVKTFDTPQLISAQVMELLGVMSEENISVTTIDNDMLFTTTTEAVYAQNSEKVESFPIDAIKSLTQQEFKSKCTVSRLAVLDVLDRLSLFVSPYDKKAVKLTFTNEGMMISSKKSSGVEVIPYASIDSFEDYTCTIDIEMLKSQVMTQTEDNLALHFGNKIAIKLVCNNVVEIIALMENE